MCRVRLKLVFILGTLVPAATMIANTIAQKVNKGQCAIERQSRTMSDVVIAGYARSPFHPAYRGALAKVRPDDLAANTIKGLIERTGVKAEDIEDVLMGCAFPEGEQGFNIARLVVLLKFQHCIVNLRDAAKTRATLRECFTEFADMLIYFVYPPLSF